MNGFIISIVSTVLLVVMLEMLAPQGKIKKYIDLISGLIIIIVLINPILTILKKGINVTELPIFQSTPDLKMPNKNDIVRRNAKQQKAIINTYKKNMSKDIEAAIYEIIGSNVNIKTNFEINEDINSFFFGDIKKINIVLSLFEDKLTATVKKDLNGKNIRVNTIGNNKVTIQRKEPNENANKIYGDLKENIKNKVSKMLMLPIEKIAVDFCIDGGLK